MEDGVLVAKINSALSLSLLSSAQASEVLGSLGDNIAVQLDTKFHQTGDTSKTILPAGAPPMEMSKKTRGRDISQVDKKDEKQFRLDATFSDRPSLIQNKQCSFYSFLGWFLFIKYNGLVSKGDIVLEVLLHSRGH